MNTTLNIRVNKKLKENARRTFKKMGLDVSSGIKIYLNQVVNNQSIPFEVRTENGFTPKQEEKMIKEAEWALKHGKSYKNAKELFADILKK